MTSLRQIRIFLSSPGDVADERAIALEVFSRLQEDPFLRDQITVRGVAWDKPGADTPLLATMTPQEAINEGLPKPSECDIVIVIFWSRMGTPLPFPEYKKDDGHRYFSGTEWEFYDALNAAKASPEGKPLLAVYRRTEPLSLSTDDPQFKKKFLQQRRVQRFFDTFVDTDESIKQGYNPYTTPEDFRAKLENHIRRLIKRLLPETTGEPVKKIRPQESPFPGLRAFTAGEGRLFFGRGEETDDLVNLVRDSRFVAIFGDSGSGKSSLVSAGLLPRLTGNAVTGSRDWIVIRFAPAGDESHDPFAALAVQLAPLLDDWNDQDLAKHLQSHPEELPTICRLALKDKKKWSEVLLFVDQFEQLFTQVDAKLRDPFIVMLNTIPESRKVRVVLTLRSDFFQNVMQYPKLNELAKRGSYTLLKPGLKAAREMIERPAALSNLDLEPGLVDAILNDMSDAVGPLPLMAYALHELYERCKDTGVLTVQAYRDTGGVKGAIATQADDQYSRLSPASQAALPQVFRKLVAISEGHGPVARRGVRASTLGSETPVQEFVAALDKAHLLVYSRDSDNQSTVEIAHEAILTTWAKLKPWLESDGDFLRWRARLEGDVREWKDKKRNPSYLYSGLRLNVAQDWQKKYPGDFSADEMAFLKAASRRKQRQRVMWRLFYSLPLVLLWLVLLRSLYNWNVIQIASGSMISFSASDARLGPDRGQVHVPAFSLERYEVSNGQYNLCVEQGTCLPPLYPSTISEAETADNMPVEWVTATQAEVFCKWLGRRLPTAAEWERAARGTDGRKFPWSDDAAPTLSRVNWGIDGSDHFPEMAVAVDDPAYVSGSTPEGMMHMLGNVREWTATPAGCGVTCDHIWNGTEPVDIRGQGWASGMWINDTAESPLAEALPSEANQPAPDLGFRCAAN